MKIFLTLLCCFAGLSVLAQTESLKKANEYLQDQKYTEAIDAFNNAGRESPLDAISLFRLGICYHLAGHYQQAVEAVKSGFSNYETLMNTPDLTELRKDKRFAELSQRVLANTRPCEIYLEYRQLDFWIG